jgi:hypothetical protein
MKIIQLFARISIDRLKDYLFEDFMSRLDFVSAFLISSFLKYKLVIM